jgi:hypothetical protein
MLITVRVTNRSALPITITGVKGQARVGGAKCNWPAELESGPVAVTYQDITIRQPITSDMASAIGCYDLREEAKALNLCDPDHRVPLDLTGIEWIGVVTTKKGEKALPVVPVVASTWLMWGPFYPNEQGDENVLVPTTSGLVSQKYWLTDGRYRAKPKAPEPEPPPPPTWIENAVKTDSDDLRGAILAVDDESQNHHVSFGDLDHEHEPGIVFRFQLLNASVYTIEFISIGGDLQMDGKAIPGYFTIIENQVSRVFPRRRRYHFYFKFVPKNPHTLQALKTLVEKRREDNSEIYFDLDHLKLVAQAHEDPNVVAELRFPQQYWRPSHEKGRD